MAKKKRIIHRAAVDAERLRVFIAIGTYSACQRQMIHGIRQFAMERAPGWEFEFRRGYDALRLLMERADRFDAILGHFPGRTSEAFKPIRGKKVPTVLIEEYEIADVPVVNSDNQAISRMAFDHLRSKGFRRYAYVRCPAVVFEQRRRAFLAAAQEAGFEAIESPLVNLGLAAPEDDPVMRRWFENLPKPVALFTGDVGLARQSVAVCRKLGTLVPEEVAVLGVDDEEVDCELSCPPLSTIDHGMRRAGYEAAALLKRLLAGEPPPAQPILVQPVGVIERQSTDTLAVEDPDVRAAVRLIWERAASGMTVKELLAFMPATRRRIEIGFRKYLGRTVHEELIRVRVERAKVLLRTTELPLPQVAAASGFQYSSHLGATFRKVVGIQPIAFRRKSRTG